LRFFEKSFFVSFAAADPQSSVSDQIRFLQEIRFPDLFTFSPADLGWLAVTGGCCLSTSTGLRSIGMTRFLWVIGQQLAIGLAPVSRYHLLVVIV